MSDFVNVYTPDGDPANIPADQLDAALTQGFKQMSPADVQHEKAKDAASGVAGGAIAAGSAAADTLSFGAFKPLVNKFAPTYGKVIDVSQEAHPLLSDAGTIAGLVPAATGGVAKGITAAGQAVADRVATPIADKALGYATEGALASAPKATAQVIADDNEEAGETLLAGGLAGLGLGTIAGTVQQAGKALAPYVSKVGQSFAKTIDRFNEEQSFKAIGGQKSIRAGYTKKGWDDADFSDFISWAKEKGFVQMFEDPATLRENAATFKAQTGQQIGDIFSQLDSSGVQTIDSGKLWNDFQQIGDSIPSRRIAASRQRAFKTAMADLGDLVLDKDAAGNVIGIKPLSFADAQQFKQDLAALAYPGQGASGKVRSATRIYSQLERTVDDAIEGGLDTAGMNAQGTPLAETWLAAKRDYKYATAIEKPLNNLIASRANQFIRPSDIGFGIGLSGGGGMLGGVPGLVMGIVVNHLRQEYGAPAAAIIFDKALKAGKDITQRISSATGNVLAGNGSAARIASFDLLNALTGEDDKQAAVDKVIGGLGRFVSDPEAQANQLSSVTGFLSQTDPAVTTVAHRKFAQAVNILLREAPRRDVPTPFQSGVGRYTDAEMSGFERKLGVVLNPIGSLEDMAKGTLDPPSTLILKELYPRLYARMAGSLINGATDKPRDYSFGQRLNLSLFFGKEVDTIATPQNMQILQAQYKTAPQNQSQRKPKIAENYQTENERLLGR